MIFILFFYVIAIHFTSYFTVECTLWANTLMEAIINYEVILTVKMISSPDPRGHLSYCYHWASVVRLSLTFCTLTTPLKPLGQFEPNFGGMVLGWSPFRIVSDNPLPTKMAAITKNRKFSKKSLKNYLLWNCWANWAQTMMEWSFGGHLSELYPKTPAANQDSRRY